MAPPHSADGIMLLIMRPKIGYLVSVVKTFFDESRAFCMGTLASRASLARSSVGFSSYRSQAAYFDFNFTLSPAMSSAVFRKPWPPTPVWGLKVAALMDRQKGFGE